MNTLKNSMVLAGLVAFGLILNTAGAAVLGPDLIQNGDMELNNEGGYPAFWLPGGDAVLSASINTPDSSNQSLLITSTGTPPGTYTGNAYQGNPYFITIPAGGGTYQLDFDYNNNDSYIYVRLSSSEDGNLMADASNSALSGWNHYAYSEIVVPTTTTTASLQFFVHDTGGSVLVDNVSLRQVMAVPEPASLGLLGLGTLVLGLRRRR